MARKRAKSNRKERVPFGVARKKMNLDDATMAQLEREDKVPRWFNDVKDRIPRALSAGYKFIEADADVKVGDAKESQDEDRRIRKLVGREKDNSPIYAYLMAIPKKYYDQDKEEKRKINQRIEQSIRAGKPQGLNDHGVSSNQGSTSVKHVNYTP